MSQVLKPKKGYKKVKWLFGQEIKIPQEWEVKKVDLPTFEYLVSGTNARSDLNESSEIRYIHYGDIHTKWNLELNCDSEKIPRIDKEKVSKLPLLKEGDLIIADASEDIEGSGSSILLKNVKNKKIVAGLHTIVLRSKDENISTDFLKYLTSINSVKIQIISYVTGSKVYGLSKKTCKEIKVPFPKLSEQQKIASILSNIDNLINFTQKVIDQNKSLKQGLMQKLFTKGIGHKKFKKEIWLFGKEIKIPEEWKIIRIGDVCFVTKLAGFEYTKYIVYQDVGEVPLIKAQNVQMGKFSNKNIQYISKKISDFLVRSKVGNNDVLMVFIGAGIGNVCHAPSGEWNLAPNVARISPKKINDVYLLFFLQSEIGQKATIFFSTSTAKESISMGEIRKIKITLPSISEQQKIASILSNVDSQIQSQTQYKEKLEKLKKSLMQKLLTGQVRVAV